MMVHFLMENENCNGEYVLSAFADRWQGMTALR